RDEASELGRWVGVAEEGLDVGTVGHGNVVVVPGNGDIEERLEDAALGREQPVHGGGRYVGERADGVDRRGPITTFQEQLACRVDDRGPSESGAGLTAVDLCLPVRLVRC